MRLIQIKIISIISILIFVINITGCCSKYNYSIYMKEVEQQLKNKKYKKAKNLLSYAYKEESKKSSDDNFEKRAWIFYRLGVVHELLGDLDIAKGYYWGDSFEEGYYKKEPKIAWLAQTGWVNIDNAMPTRTYDEILALEAKEPPKKEVKKEKKIVKRKAKKKTAYVPRQRLDLSGPNRPPVMYKPDEGDEGVFAIYR